MAATLPIKTTAEDIEAILSFLGSKPGWVEVSAVKTTLGSRGDTRKLNTLHYLGIVERDAGNIKLTASGRDLARADAANRGPLFAKQTSATPLYHRTLEWVHYQGLESPTKVDVAAHWLGSEAALRDAAEGLITDGVITFFRIAELAGLGKFVPAGGNREGRFDVDRGALARFMGQSPEPPAEEQEAVGPPEQPPASQGAAVGKGVTLDPGVRINIEIHIAADATPSTVEEIFKNMRKYVLTDPDQDVE